MNPNILHQIPAVLLAGGQSKRMGTAKALLSVSGDQNLIQFHTQQLSQQFKRVYIAGGSHRFNTNAGLKVQYLDDAMSNAFQGPLSALLGVMQALSADTYVLVWSCDTLITTAQVLPQLHHAIHILAQQKALGGIYLATAHDYPLLGIYRTNIAPELADYLATGERRVMPFLKLIQAQRLHIDHQLAVLANFNTPLAFDSARAAYSSSQFSITA